MYFIILFDNLINDVLVFWGLKNINWMKVFDDFNFYCVRLRLCCIIFIDWVIENDDFVFLGLNVL